MQDTRYQVSQPERDSLSELEPGSLSAPERD